ncbi:MAG TPA: hypothetical protein O0X13_04220, partial [Methanocorpusculum sp.]|nr:hypothetical protein [Methanocorpusculum sp.]
SKRYGSISQVARILATRSALLEKLAEDGPFTQQIRSKESSVSLIKEELSVSRNKIEMLEENTKKLAEDTEGFAVAYTEYREAIMCHNKRVALLAEEIQRYNQLVDEYNRLAAALAYLQHNRLDRPQTFARIQNLRI